VLQARDATGPAGGVGPLSATPFAAGQAPAVPRQPPALGRARRVVFTRAQPHVSWGCACPPVRCARYAAVIRRRGS